MTEGYFGSPFIRTMRAVALAVATS